MNTRTVRMISRAVAAAGIIALFSSLALSQQTVNWTDGAKTQLWSTKTNWDANLVPGRDCSGCNVNVPDTGTGTTPTQDISPLTLNNLAIAGNSTVTMPDNALLTLNGTSLRGFLFMNNSGGAASTNLLIDGDVVYTDNISGLSMMNNSQITGGGILDNQGTITYGRNVATSHAGGIGNSVLTVKNSQLTSRIISGGTGSNLILEPNASWLNAGSFDAQGGGLITIAGGTITQQATGNILANGGTVNLGGSAGNPTITGGQLLTSGSNGGTIQACPGATLSNLTINGIYNVVCPPGSSSSTTLVGTITNNGRITLLNSDAKGVSGSTLLINSPVTLAGTGSVSLQAGFNGLITGSGPLTNQQTISGPGKISVATVTNQGSIGATSLSSNSTLTLEPGSGGFTNSGTLTAFSTATLEISGGKVTNTGTIGGGTSAGKVLLDNNVTVAGGTITGPATVEGKLATLDGTTSTVNITGNVLVGAGDKTTLKGTINISGAGNIDVVGGTSLKAVVQITGTTQLNGTGTVDLSNDTPNTQVIGNGVGSSKLINNVKINGNGQFLGLNFVNGKAGTVSTFDAGTPITFGSTTSVTNNGTFIVNFNQKMQFLGTLTNSNATTHTLTGGIWIVNDAGQLQFQNADIVNNAANVTLNGGEITNQNGQNAFLNFTNNLSPGKFSVGSGLDFTTSGTLNNAGGVAIGSGSVLSIGGTSTNYNQTSGTTTVDGTLSIPAGGEVKFTGGTLFGSGTITGNVFVGNPAGGAPATFVVGNSLKSSSLFTLEKDYTQQPTGALDIQIGGLTAGSQYSELNVTGKVTLNGVLNLKIVNNFHPQVGQTFTVFNAPSGIGGKFTTVNGTAINSSSHFKVSVNPTTIVATVESGQ